MDGSPIQYEALVARFAEGLLTSLRGHGVELDFLETWVPDEDPVKGILNMAESAGAAGVDALAVAVGRDTLLAARDDELRQRLAELASAKIELVGLDGLVIRFSGLVAAVARTPAAGGSKAIPPDRIALTDRPAETTVQLAAAVPNSVTPALRAGIAHRLTVLAHEGPLDPAMTTTSGLVKIETSDPPTWLALLVDPADHHRIRVARHGGGAEPAERAVLDVLCEAITDIPLAAVGNGPTYALARLLDQSLPRPVAGILLPANADPAFGPALRLTRALRPLLEQAGLTRDYDTFASPPSPGWLAHTAAERMALVEQAVAGFMAANGGRIAAGAHVLRLDDNLTGQPVRVVIELAPGDTADAALRPRLVRQLEKVLKTTVEPTLQIYIDPVKDQNQLRRLQGGAPQTPA
ncbi:conserved hypothetical protein [uncultured Gammaproteobacteria bacterium]